VWVARPRGGSEFQRGSNTTANFRSFISVLCVPVTSVCGLCCLMLYLCKNVKSGFVFAIDHRELKTYEAVGVYLHAVPGNECQPSRSLRLPPFFLAS
jgi:hypothetical protein